MKPLVCLNWNRLASRNEFSIVGRKSFCLPGFTLVELLVTIAAGAFLMAGAASLITSQIRSNIVSELAQRVRDDANRLNFLLQTEAGEAISITRSGSIPNNCGESGTTAFQFGLNVLPLTGDSDDAVADAKAITFYNKTVSGVTSIWRCGPPIQRNGSLDFDSASPVKSLLVENASLTVVNTCGTTVVGTTDTRMVAYQPILSDTPSSYQPPCNILRARALFITD